MSKQSNVKRTRPEAGESRAASPRQKRGTAPPAAEERPPAAPEPAASRRAGLMRRLDEIIVQVIAGLLLLAITALVTANIPWLDWLTRFRAPLLWGICVAIVLLLGLLAVRDSRLLYRGLWIGVAVLLPFVTNLLIGASTPACVPNDTVMFFIEGEQYEDGKLFPANQSLPGMKPKGVYSIRAQLHSEIDGPALGDYQCEWNIFSDGISNTPSCQISHILGDDTNNDSINVSIIRPGCYAIPGYINLVPEVISEGVTP